MENLDSVLSIIGLTTVVCAVIYFFIGVFSTLAVLSGKVIQEYIAQARLTKIWLEFREYKRNHRKYHESK